MLILALSPMSAHSDQEITVDRLLRLDTQPAGVVFEIVSDDEDFLREILPEVHLAVESVRGRFPQLPIAIVSHGKEQFALSSKDASMNTRVHELTRQLVDDEVEVHVCGTHAGWYGVSPEDFPKYVDVTPAGPTQIDHYEELGYELIFVTDD